MKNVVIDGDIATGTCRSHSSPQSVQGPVTAGQSYCQIKNVNVAQEGDIVHFNCGHTGIVHATDRNSVILNIKPIVDGDPVGPGTGDITATIHSSQTYCQFK